MDETNQRESLRYDGVLVPAKIININTPSHSYLIESYRQIGERVKKNELIARWASPELLNQHYQAKREFIEAKERLHALKNWAKSDEIARAKREVQQYSLQAIEAKNRFKQTERLFEAGIVSKEEVNIDKRSYQQILANKEQAVRTLTLAHEKGSNLQIELAKMKLAASKERLDYLNEEVKRLEYRSPIEGVLIAPDHKSNESYAQILDPTKWNISIQVNEWDAAILKPNQEVSISFSSWPQYAAKGHIQTIQIDPIERGDKSQLSRYQVMIHIDSPLDNVNDKLRMGMSVMVNCEFEERGIA